MTHRHIVLDVETYSEVDLKSCGVDVYARSRTTRCLCAAWVEVDETFTPLGDIVLWKEGDPPPDFADTTIWAWNVRFDAAIIEHVLTPRYGWPVVPASAYHDIMLRAAYGNLPMSLEACGKVLRSSCAKDRAGHALMLRMCKPAPGTTTEDNPCRHHTPEAIRLLAEYCKQDVRAEAHLAALLPNVPLGEMGIADLDATINQRGVGVDLELVAGCTALAELISADGRQRLQDLTGGAVETETKLAAFVRWITATIGDLLPLREGRGAFDKAAVQAYIQELEVIKTVHPERADTVDTVVSALSLRSSLGLTSMAKFGSLAHATSPDGRLRNTLQHYGAHQTGRWAGRLVQMHNLPKGVLAAEQYAFARALARGCSAGPAVLQDIAPLFRSVFGDAGDPITPDNPGPLAVLGSLLRTCFVAGPGKTFCICDYNAVEARGVLWLADDQTGLDIFRGGRDIYKFIVSVLMGVPVSSVSKADRNRLGKPTILGSGYGMGAARFASQFNLPEAMGEQAVATYRNTFAGVPRLWKDLEKAAVRAIRNPFTLITAAKGRVVFYFNETHLMCRIPSGRTLFYRNARLVPGRFEGTESVEFAYEDLVTKAWVRGVTWGGVFTENIVQALCRDLLAHALGRLEVSGFPAVLHVHDEVVSEIDDPGTDAARSAKVHEMEQIMCELPPWAEGFPVTVEGFASPYWRK